MTKAIKVSTIILFSLIISFLTYKTCYFIAEKFFFDKFFYQKSANHGYILSKNDLTTNIYGDRIEDIVAINSNNQQILGQANNNTFNIAIIGDSFVWGQGIKNSERFTKLLSNKLNKIKPTKIISVGVPGDQELDYLESYHKIKNFKPINLYIFTLVSNDAYIGVDNDRIEHDYANILSDCKSKYPNITPVYDLSAEIKNTEIYKLNVNDIQQQIYKIQTDSWNNPINICVINSVTNQLPNENSIYFFANSQTNTYLQNYYNIIKQSNKHITLFDNIISLPKYKNYFSKNNNVPFVPRVSQNDDHPNALANKMYADVLFDEITTNSRWGFNNEK